VAESYQSFETLFSSAFRMFVPTIRLEEVTNYSSQSKGPDVSAEVVAFRSAARLHFLGTIVQVWVRRNFDPISAWGELSSGSL
jgi:hypothetical protein